MDLKTKRERVEYEIIMATRSLKNTMRGLLAYTDIEGNDFKKVREAIEILEKVKYNF